MARNLKAFISYSHADEHALERFTRHLAVLKREGAITEWFDQKIAAGGNIDAEISKHLSKCDLFIALVSPDFLGSTYCYDIEMKRALERHEAGTLRVVPVIVQPCDWKASPLGKLKALPKDGKSVPEWTNENSAWLDVITQLRALVRELDTSVDAPAQPAPEQKRAVNTKYRVKRTFDEVDRMDFREKAFATIRDYFKRASSEINDVAGIRAKFSSLGDDGFTCTVVNRARERGVGHITVYASGSRSSIGDITYSFQERAAPNTANGWLAIDSDDYEQFLKINDMMRSDEREKFSPEKAAEVLWEKFIEQAGIAYG